MSHETYLLDTSAVIAFLENEPGSERVEEVLDSENVLIPWTVLFEVYYIIYRKKGQVEADKVFPSIKGLASTLLWDNSEAFVLNAARMKAQHRLSVADTMIAAYALENDAVLLHKDPEFNPLSEFVRQEKLPFK